MALCVVFFGIVVAHILCWIIGMRNSTNTTLINKKIIQQALGASLGSQNDHLIVKTTVGI